MDKSADHPIADEPTLDRARCGEPDALADLWAIYHPQLLRMLWSRRREPAEEIASQVWIDVGRDLERFDGDGAAFRAWVFSIARRRVFDEDRRAVRRVEQRRAPVLAATPPAAAAGRGAAPSDEALDAVIARLATLRPAVAEALLLRVIHDLSVAEAAAVTGRSEGDVGALTHRCLHRLRRLLDDRDAGFAEVPLQLA